jgi:tRNA dimethylallyltransferase
MDWSATFLTEHQPPRVLIVAGPTASGKSALALTLAETFGGVLVNADSQQRYRDLRILTARPSPAEEARVPHRLFGDLAAEDAGSAAEWAVKTAAEIQAITREGKVPVLVGGTGLYFRALMEGLTDMPAVPPDVRAAAADLLRSLGHQDFHARLATRDPVSAARLHAGDTQRMLRAWEVIEATGIPLSDWHQSPGAPPIVASYLSILLLPPRAELYDACDARFLTMIEHGALAEVQSLMDRSLVSHPVGKALGVSHLVAHLEGALALEEAIILAQTATRQYAKRQMTWFRNQFNAQLVLKTKLSESLTDENFSNIRRFLLT